MPSNNFNFYKKSRSAVWAYKNIYRRLFPTVPHYLKRDLSGCQSVLDLGCGWDSPISSCGVSYSVGVEGFLPYLEESKKKKIHNKYINADVKEVDFEAGSFDAVIAIDVLEHLKKEDGWALLAKMEAWSKKKIIIFTPNGFIAQDDYDSNSLQVHRSGWSVCDLENLGFKVRGMNGLKKLRGTYRSFVRFKPALFWELMSDCTQKITYFLPEAAFALFAVKGKKQLVGRVIKK